MPPLIFIATNVVLAQCSKQSWARQRPNALSQSKTDSEEGPQSLDPHLAGATSLPLWLPGTAHDNQRIERHHRDQYDCD